jgi:hypothetical protein
MVFAKELIETKKIKARISFIKEFLKKYKKITFK